MLGWSDAREKVLGAFRTAAGPLALHEVATATGVTPAAALRHLQLLVAAGALEKVGRGPSTRYAARPFVETWAIQPAAKGAALTFAWQASGPLSWRFPLAARVRDETGRAELLRLLEEADWRGLFHPWLLLTQDQRAQNGLAHVSAPSVSARMGDLALARAPDFAQTWVVYGSCARGDAHARSDLDLLILLPPVPPRAPIHIDTRRMIQDLVDEANLWAKRRIDLHMVDRDAFDSELPEELRSAILRDGVTVHTTFPGGEFIEHATRSEDA